MAWSLTAIPRPIIWKGSARHGWLHLLDQRQLPNRQRYLDCRQAEQVARAIRVLAVRGAPAIGIAAAYACVLAARQNHLQQSIQLLQRSRPTAVNLFAALNRMQRVHPPTPARLLREARRIHRQDERMCLAIGRHGLRVLAPLLGGTEKTSSAELPGVLTHCNAGALATGGIGTATAPLYLAHRQSLRFQVFVDETRPLLQGARLTAWELARAGLNVTLITDSMAASLMQAGRIAAVIVGADRIAANGDIANKVGTYALAVLAHYHRIPFFVAAPTTSFDLSLAHGRQIPIEHRAGQEILGRLKLPRRVRLWNPAFDRTPARFISAIITDRSLIQPVTRQRIRDVLGSPQSAG